MEGFYRFPAIVNPSKKNLCRTPIEQGQKVIKEARELFDEAERSDERRHEMGIEAMDVIHATETLLRRNFTEQEVRALRDECERKNAARGFYKC